jgi:hypothetical protein
MGRAHTVDGSTAKYTLENGEYMWRVIPEVTTGDRVFRTSDGHSDKGDEQINLVLKVGTRDEQITVLDRLTFSSRAQWRVSEFLRSAGAYPGHGVSIDLKAEQCIGLGGKCRTLNGEPDYKGKVYTSIDRYLEAEKQDPGKIKGLVCGDDFPPPTANDEPATDEDPIPF